MDLQERIATVISTKGMTNAEFAEAIGVQPSNISHIMSGRNKPSLDLVMKILKRFPELRSDWMLSGKGSMTREFNLFGYDDEPATPKKQEQTSPETARDARGEMAAKISQASGDKTPENSSKNIEVEDDKEADESVADFTEKIKNQDPRKISAKKIEKIVIFYGDRTFREYFPGD